MRVFTVCLILIAGRCGGRRMKRFHKQLKRHVNILIDSSIPINWLSPYLEFSCIPSIYYIRAFFILKYYNKKINKNSVVSNYFKRCLPLSRVQASPLEVRSRDVEKCILANIAKVFTRYLRSAHRTGTSSVPRTSVFR